MADAVSVAVICDRLSMNELREFFHEDYIGGSHDQEVCTEVHRHWPTEL